MGFKAAQRQIVPFDLGTVYVREIVRRKAAHPYGKKTVRISENVEVVFGHGRYGVQTRKVGRGGPRITNKIALHMAMLKGKTGKDFVEGLRAIKEKVWKNYKVPKLLEAYEGMKKYLKEKEIEARGLRVTKEEIEALMKSLA